VWNEELWDQKGRKYGDWLSALCFCMLQYLLDFVKRNDLTKNPGIERHRNLLMLMSVLAPACLVSVEISELVFPLLVFEIIHLCGAQSVATTTLSRHIFKYLLHENADIQCCKLGCDTLVFLLRQNIEDFKNGKELTQPSSEQQSQSTRVNGQYSYFLTIDYESAAAAAIRCKCTSIALLFAELYSQQSGATVIRALQMADTANQVSLKASEKLKSLLIPIYRSVNDVDMIEGLDFSTDLYLQAECYAAKNQWLQALSTYESILSAQHDIPIEVVSEGMGACLEGLGTKSFVQKSGAIGKYNNRVDSNKHNAEYDLSIWFDDQDPTFAGSAKLSEEFLAITARIENLNIRAEGFCALKVLCKKSISSALNAYIFEDMKTASMNLHMVSDFGKLVLCGNYGEEATVPISNKSILDSFSSQLSYHASNHAQLFNIRRPLAVLAALARAKRITSFEAMIPVKELCKWDADLSHKISPSLYGFWREMEVNVRSQSNQLDSVLLQGMIDIQKSLLLWGKGMSDASIHMISVVKDVVTRERGGLKKSSGRPADKSSQYVDRLYAEAMRTIGVWLSKRGSISPNDVLVKYLQPALSGCKDLNVLIESTYAVAQFSYEMFVNLDQKINSSEWKMGMKVLHHREIEFQQCSALKPADSTKAVISFNGINIDVREFMRHINMLKKEIDMDKKERNLVEVSLISFLKLALHHFGKVLQLQSKQSITESNDLKVDSQDVVFRLIGLWLSNSEKNEANETMGMILPSISSHFFVPLTYQILSRLGLNANAGSSPSNPLSSSNTSFEGVLKQLVFGICRDHPYHCLPQLFALINGTTSLNSQVVKGNISTDRKLAAEEIYHQLIAAGTDVSKIATCMEKFLQNYIELAVASTEIFHKSGKCKGIKFSDVQARGKRFHELLESYPIKPPILTKDISISIRGQDYATNGFITTIVEIPPDFSITENGISRPKIIICRGDDGRSYRQLVKSGDDMRQDAVMEQVFRTVNQILRRYESTRTRQLNIRTYNVIPTTNQTGLLEWVENTAPIGMLLVDKDKGLHNRYSLKDWKHHQCRDHLKNAVDNEDKEKRFNEICTNFHPVFKYFFLESFSHPFDWLHRRLAYIHSVAANSITGYILGIGDRHAFNILIDTITGEAVHIDFGIVFDQGKGLLTPETVPFRLTREIVDGMGITGCEGSFRRSCEEVMKVLRANASHMLTILEVIIHDPLYKWSLSPFEAQLKQSKQKEGGEVGGGKLQLAVASPTPTPRKSGSKESGGKASLQEKDRPQTPGVNASAPENASAADSTNFGKEAAERTLLRIRNKLRGFENPTGEALGVESHIDLLINEARNPFNLCKIFPGWAPWL
jgi:ataxia telangiectasia mutated family protein